MPIIIVLVAFAVLVSGALYFYSTSSATTTALENEITLHKNKPTTTTPEVITVPQAVTPEPAPILNETKPAEVTPAQTLAATIEYRSPSQNPESIAVNMTIENGVVTKVSNVYNGGIKQNGYQKRFDSVYQTLVVGKKLESISLSRVGGASLTSRAFNEAIQKFITQTNS